MDINAVRAELVTVLNTITGLRAYSFTTAAPPPLALPGWPDEISYNETYAQGMTRIPDLPLYVLVGKASERSAATKLGAFTAESGAKSIPAKLNARTGLWTSCDVVTVLKVDFDTTTYGGNELLAAVFHLDIVGKGA